jgi:hypothetical protein
MNNGHDADREVVAKILGLEGREIDRVGIAAEQRTGVRHGGSPSFPRRAVSYPRA